MLITAEGQLKMLSIWLCNFSLLTSPLSVWTDQYVSVCVCHHKSNLHFNTVCFTQSICELHFDAWRPSREHKRVYQCETASLLYKWKSEQKSIGGMLSLLQADASLHYVKYCNIIYCRNHCQCGLGILILHPLSKSGSWRC